MSGDLISRSAAIHAIDRRIPFMVGDKRVGVESIKLFLTNRPAVDAVQVVRCKDCVLWKRIDEHTGKCPFLIGEHQYAVADHYCSCGERKEEDTDEQN